MSNKIHLLRKTIKLLITEQLQQQNLGFDIVKTEREMIIGVVFETENILQTIKTDPNIKKYIDILDGNKHSSTYSANIVTGKQ